MKVLKGLFLQAILLGGFGYAMWTWGSQSGIGNGPKAAAVTKPQQLPAILTEAYICGNFQCKK